MNQTEHYKLSQWEPSDRIEMEDFNADNAKVETALAGLESRKLELVKLGDYSASFNGDAPYWFIPLDPEIVSKALVVLFYFHTPGNEYPIGMGQGGSKVGSIRGSYPAFALVPGAHPTARPGMVPLDGVSAGTSSFSYPASIRGLSVLPYHTGSVIYGDFECTVKAVL